MHVRRLAGLFLLIVSCVTRVFAQSNAITAEAIIQRAIDSTGGKARMDSIHSIEFITRLITPDKKELSLAVKKQSFNKYYVSSLSEGHANSTTIYNEGNAVIIEGDSVKRIIDPGELEGLRLQCYISKEYGYAKLGYKLTRLDDQAFRNFDCYVVLAASPLGRLTANYYDKITGRPVMTIYPDQHKVVYTDFYKSTSLVMPSKILLTDTKNDITQSSIQKLDYNNNFDPYWFHLPPEGKYVLPQVFRTGVFSYLNSSDSAGFTRDEGTQVEISNGQRTEYKVRWESSNDYLLFRLKKPDQPATDENIEYFRVRIICWDDKRYYCQYITSDNRGGTCAFEKKKL